MKEEQKPIVNKRAERQLKCDLTNIEMLVYGQRMAEWQQAVAELEKALLEYLAENKSKASEAECALSRYAAAVRRKYEYRRVACEVAHNYVTEMVTAMRLDTGEEIESRPMTDDELQQLPL